MTDENKSTPDDKDLMQDDADIFDAMLDDDPPATDDAKGGEPDPLDDDQSGNSETDQAADQGGEQPDNQKPAQDKEQQQDEPPEWYKNLDDESRAQVDALYQAEQERQQLRHQYQALHGRLAPIQQQNAQLMRQLQELSNGQEKQPDAQGEQFTPPTPQDLSGSEAFEKYKKEFPEEAAAIESEFRRRDQQVASLESKLQQLDKGVRRFDEMQANQQQQQAFNELASRHPDFAECVNSEEYQQFLQHQPAEVQRIAMTTQDPATAAWVLDQFKGTLEQQIAAMEAQNQPSAQPNGDAQKLRNQRQRVLQQAAPNAGNGGLGVLDTDANLSEADMFDSLLE